MKHHRKSSKYGELAGDSQWHAMASAKILFGEFRSHAQIYGAFTLTLGLLFGLRDGPRTDVEPPEPNTERKTELADVRKQIPAAPRELGFWRQFIVTTPGVALALRLGVKGQAMKAPPSAILLTLMPTVWGPFVLYLFGYPMGIRLHIAFYG